MSDEEQLQAPTHKKATKVGGRRVGQDKAHHHASSEQQKSTARSIVADSTPHPPSLTTSLRLLQAPVLLGWLTSGGGA